MGGITSVQVVLDDVRQQDWTSQEEKTIKQHRSMASASVFASRFPPSESALTSLHAGL